MTKTEEVGGPTVGSASVEAATPKSAAVSKETSTAIAMAWREIEAAEGLLADIADTRSRNEAPDIRDAFGQRQDGLQLGVPSGQNRHRLFNVPWPLCKPIIEAHIAAQRGLIAVLSAKAIIEAAQ